MTKYDDLDDLDLELEETENNQKDSEYYDRLEIIKEKAESFNLNSQVTKEQNEWEDCITKMEQHCNKGWICIPRKIKSSSGLSEKLGIVIRDVDHCTGKEFLEWLFHVWPLAKDLNVEAKDYEDAIVRHMMIKQLETLHGMLAFPKTS